ncbi:hypothetical protein ACIF8T_21330 [Streptomyces sp. NPDC085946]|uniref:hypothetical protein n=1 Tax=Streptomyces sp. NPDC085946 TaxID=3365744 RepID=UPI0037D788F2
MTTVVHPSTDWIRFDTPLGGWLQLDTEEWWQPQLSVDAEKDPVDVGLEAAAHAMPAPLVTVDLVLPHSDAGFSAEAVIRRVHELLARQSYCGIEAAVTLPGLPYNRVHLPRVRIVDLSVSRIVTADGKPGLRFVEGEACEVAPGRRCMLTQVG